jgi:hypothetical protein
MQNKIITKNGIKYPGNEHVGALLDVIVMIYQVPLMVKDQKELYTV